MYWRKNCRAFNHYPLLSLMIQLVESIHLVDDLYRMIQGGVYNSLYLTKTYMN